MHVSNSTLLWAALHCPNKEITFGVNKFNLGREQTVLKNSGLQVNLTMPLSTIEGKDNTFFPAYLERVGGGGVSSKIMWM